jgi:ribonuclease G
VGDIFLGRVIRVVPGMQAAFIDLGLDRAGFLGAREARELAGPTSDDEAERPRIETYVQEGAHVLVQVIKNPVGDKGVRLSANVTLPGRYLVYAPLQQGVTVSRRIADEAERQRLTGIGEALLPDLGGGGLIIRTVAEGVDDADITGEVEALTAAWRAVEEKRKAAKAPARLSADIGPVERALRDHAGPHVRRVVIDQAAGVKLAKDYCAVYAPEFAGRIERHTGPGTLFDSHDLESVIEEAMEPRVPLPSGGSITIETTEALTAIDVNSGSYADPGGIERTSLLTNLEAARAIAWQLRLRGIGGIVVADFIHMERKENVRKVLAELERAFADDRVPVRLLGMSELGLVQLTRKRTGEPLAHWFSEACEPCAGAGWVPTRATMAARIERRAVAEAAHHPGGGLVVRTAPDVAAWMSDPGRLGVDALSRRIGRAVAIEGDPAYDRHQFSVSTGG